VAGRDPADVAQTLAAADVAVWPGDSYALEAARALGLADRGTGVRAGVVCYVDDDDVQQLLRVIDKLG